MKDTTSSRRDPTEDRITGKNLFRGFVLRILTPMLILPISMTTSVYIARRLGAEGYGLLNLAISTMTLFFLFWTNLGVHASLTKHIAQLRARGEPGVRETISRIFWVKLGVTLAVGSALFLLSDWLAGRYETPALASMLRIGCLYVAILSFSEFTTSVLQGFARVQLTAGLSLLARLVVPLATVLAVWAGSGAPGALLAQTVGYALIAGVGIGFMWGESRGLPTGNVSIVGQVLRYALPLGVISLFSVFFEHADKALLGILGSSSEVGVYSMAKLPLSVLLRIPLALSAVLFPFTTTYFARADRATLSRLNGLLWKYFSCLAVPAVAGLVYTAPWIVDIFLTEEYHAAIPVMRVLPLVFLFKSTWHLLHPFFVGSGRAAVMSKSLILPSLLYLALAYFMGSRLGGTGIAWALVVAWALVAVSLTFRFRKDFNLRILSASLLARILVGCALMLGGMELIKPWVHTAPQLLVWILVGATIYLVSLVLLRVLNKDDYFLWRRQLVRSRHGTERG